MHNTCECGHDTATALTLEDADDLFWSDSQRASLNDEEMELALHDREVGQAELEDADCIRDQEEQEAEWVHDREYPNRYDDHDGGLL